MVGSIAVPAVEWWQLLYFGGAKNDVGLFCFGNLDSWTE